MTPGLSEKEGMKAALETLSPEFSAPLRDEPEQLELLPCGEPTLQAPENQSLPRGRGRPPGSKNKKTEEWVDFLLGRYGSPLETLAKYASLPLRELQKIVGGEMLDVLKLQINAASAVAPYMHQRQALALNLEQKTTFMLQLMEPGETEETRGDGEIVLTKNQDYSEAENEEV